MWHRPGCTFQKPTPPTSFLHLGKTAVGLSQIPDPFSHSRTEGPTRRERGWVGSVSETRATIQHLGWLGSSPMDVQERGTRCQKPAATSRVQVLGQKMAVLKTSEVHQWNRAATPPALTSDLTAW